MKVRIRALFNERKAGAGKISGLLRSINRTIEVLNYLKDFGLSTRSTDE